VYSERGVPLPFGHRAKNKSVSRVVTSSYYSPHSKEPNPQRACDKGTPYGGSVYSKRGLLLPILVYWAEIESVSRWPSQVITLPIAKSHQTRKKHDKGTPKGGSAHSERGVLLPVLTSGGEWVDVRASENCHPHPTKPLRCHSNLLPVRSSLKGCLRRLKGGLV
jgi:hypothetical protein